MSKTSSLRSKTVSAEILPNVRFFDAGARRPTESFLQPNFVEGLIQSLLHALDLQDAWVLVGGDGRAWSSEIIERAVRVLAGNRVKVQKVLVGLNCCIPLPVASAAMRSLTCQLALMFTGGHHSPGEDGYFGLKLVSPPGVPIRGSIIGKANRLAKSLNSFTTCDKLTLNTDSNEERKYDVAGGPLSIEVLDVASSYVRDMMSMFDALSIKDYLHSHCKLLICCSNGAVGPFVRRIFVDCLGVPGGRVLNALPMADFGGFPGDPTEANFREFVQRIREGEYRFGAVINPDGSRCLIVGEGGVVVTSSDSLAVVAANSQKIPVFQRQELHKVVRSICTSQAVDKVAESLMLLQFGSPVEWQHWRSAMIASKGKSTLFGSENSALGVCTDSYCGDRDAIWTILAWLTIMSETQQSIGDILEVHWKRFGRTFFGRYDFLDVPQASLDSFLALFREKNSLRFEKIKTETLSGVQYIDPFGIDQSLQTEEAKRRNTEIVFDIENYVYPYGFIKKSLIKDDQYQVYQIRLNKDTRLILRRSESIPNASTLRFYIEHRVEEWSENMLTNREAVLQPFIKAAMKITKIEDFSVKSPAFV